MTETELEMAARHVREGARHIARQREIIAYLNAQGHSVDRAVKLLRAMEESQRQHVKHRELLRTKFRPLSARDPQSTLPHVHR